MSDTVDLSFERNKRLGVADNSAMSPSELLRMALEDIASEETPDPNRAIVILARDTPNGLGFVMYRCGLNSLEEAGLLEAVKLDALAALLKL